MNRICQLILKEMLEHPDGMPAAEPGSRIKEHIKTCETCREAYYLFTFTGSFINSEVKADKAIDSRVMQSIDKNRYPGNSPLFTLKRSFYKLVPALRPIAAAAAILAVLFSALLFKPLIVDYGNRPQSIPALTTPSGTGDTSPSMALEAAEDISIEDLRKNPHFPPDEYEFKEAAKPVKIDKDTAVNTAKAVVGAKCSTEAARITAALVLVTNKKYPDIPGSDVVLRDYPVWIVTFYGIHITAHGGPKIMNMGEAQEADRQIQADTNVFIGADTGENIETISYSAFSQQDAINKALELHPGGGFPESPGKVTGIMHTGGPAPGLEIPAEFETRAERESEGVYIITLTQYWNAKDLSGPNSKGPVLNYFWKYRVTESDITEIDSGGDITPLIMK